MSFIPKRLCVAAAVVAAGCMAVAGSAAAADPSSRSDAAQADPSGAKVAYPPEGFRGGDRAQSENTGKAPSEPIVGDDIGSHPGMPGAPKYEPTTTIEVVRPERTIVRDVDEALPLVLSSTALLLGLTGLGITLVRGGTVPRPRRSH